MNKVYITDFAPNGVEHVVKEKQYFEEDIVDYGIEHKIVRVGDTDDFVDELVVFEKSRINRNDYIQSYADQSGIDNILKKLALQNDPEAIKALALKEGADIDLTKLPEDYISAIEFIHAKKEAYKKQCGDFGSIEKAATASNEDIDAYIARKVAEQLAAAGGNENA